MEADKELYIKCKDPLWDVGQLEADWTVANGESCYFSCEAGWENGCFGAAVTFHFPVVMFIHASLRLRNLKNKLENKMENWSEEDTTGDCPRCPGAAGNHHQVQ